MDQALCQVSNVHAMDIESMGKRQMTKWAIITVCDR